MSVITHTTHLGMIGVLVAASVAVATEARVVIPTEARVVIPTEARVVIPTEARDVTATEARAADMAQAQVFDGTVPIVIHDAAAPARGTQPRTEARMYKGYETPPYTVLRSDGPIELRRYAPHVVAEVRVEGSRSGAVGRGFRTLAKYIFGGNAEEAKVAMTAPVVQAPMADSGRDGRVWDVQFMMPSAYSLESLPEPKDAAVRFTETVDQEQAVIRFSGFWTDRKLREKAQALRDWAAAQGVELEGEARYYFYDDPFTLPFNRRNEVAFVIR